ncbi:MAG: sigma 54-interacting transcriptional regulator [Acidobacteriota bacterium]|nr:sigma 54-interacting transcriptional regulator [Acidobacteriota bacterium]
MTSTAIDPEQFCQELDERLSELTVAFRELHRSLGNTAAAPLQDFFGRLFRLQTWFQERRKNLAAPAAVADRSYELLYKAGLVLSGSLDVPVLLELALDTVIEMCGCGRGFLATVDPDGGFRFLTARNFDKENIPEPEMEISRSVIQRALKLRTEVKVQGEDADNSLLQKTSLLRRDGRALICVPVPIDGSIRAVIYLDGFSGSLTPAVFVMVRNFAAQLAGFMKNAEAFTALRSGRDDLLDELRRRYRFENIVGGNKAMVHILKTVARVAETDAQVLIQGETGTGKDLIARAIHQNSKRSGGPYIEIDCGALPANLIESELFGHVRGAFTGAADDRVGLLEAAHGGTVFLDEINNLPRESQTRLLRALQQRKIRRIGETRERPVDFRLLSASGKNLKEMVTAETFRQDLYYRINTVCLELPPLRRRKDDIPALLARFLEKYAEQYGRTPLLVSPEVVAALEDHDWPGNVRELEHVVERAVILCEGNRLTLDDLPFELQDRPIWEETEAPDLEEYTNKARKYHITKVLQEVGGKKVEAAKRLGVNRSYLFQLIKQLGIGQ